jgi:IclR family acetate operon transcriptional repressor
MRRVKTQLDRCFDLIELLADGAQTLRLSEIAARLDLPKSATHRLLAHLAELGWVEQDPVGLGYRLTLRLAITGQRFLLATRIPDVCQPVLQRLARRSGELVRMAVVEGRRLTWIASAQGAPSGLMYQPEMSARVVLHATANGKAWLASLPLDDAVKLALEDGFGPPGRHGPNALRSVEALIAALAETRAKGYGVSQEEAERGVAAVAAAIPSQFADDPVVGTVSIAGPVVRVTPERIIEYAALLTEAVQELSALWPLQQRPPPMAIEAAQR